MNELATRMDDAPARILVVDDEPSVADIFQEFLGDQGHQVTVAGSGEEALRVIPELRPDIVLTDINLPGMSGLEVMRFAKDFDPETAVIVVTGHASASSAIDALRQGAYDYITKPFELDEVHQIVERGLANRRLRDLNRRLMVQLQEKNAILAEHETQLRERVEQATRQLRHLYDLGREVGAQLELAPRLSLICARSADLCGARAAVVFLSQAETGDCHAAAWHGVDLAPLADLDLPSVPADGVLGPALRERVAVRLAIQDGAPAGEMPGIPGARFRTLLAAPMVAEGQVIGVLAVIDRPGGFSDDHQGFLELFGAQIAVAVRNSQLFEHTKSLDRLKSEFVAVVSHEIRTPLTSIKGAVELLSDDRFFPGNDQQRKLLAIASANTERLLVLINDILDFSKLESSSLRMNLERQRLEPVVEQALHGLRNLFEEHNIALELRVQPGLPEVLVDGGRIGQVLTNLLSNAIKFSAPGATIEVHIEGGDSGLTVRVRDYGEGIAPQDLAKLFRKFSQIDSSLTRRAGGTGLGLVICKGIIEQHGGVIGVDSAVGEGSSFYFSLPTADRATPEPAGRS